MASLHRKKFLQILGLGFASIPFCLSGKDKESDNTKPHCGFTDSTTKGPFFVKNTAETVNINFTNLPGKPIRVSGTVYGGKTGEEPLTDTKIEIWQTDDNGVYYPMGRGDVSKYEPEEIALRGHLFTNEEGAYAFYSIKPGHYSTRRRHIHYRISAPKHKKLTTEIYWLNEKGNVRDLSDRINKDDEHCRYIDFQDDGEGGEMGVFDIYLKYRG